MNARVHPIRVLSERVASQIAAGEVVERPASVVKELVENSIDAGGCEIRVEVRAGGKRFMRVVDDGCGVPVEEVELAFRRHSTSKLSTASDLTSIRTLGFRGEALASIAAVSRMTFVTRATDERVGTLLRLEGGDLVHRQESGRPAGTAVTVENLFFNVPARRKFLRTDRTERRHIDAWVTRYAMAYPELRFTLSHGGRETFQSSGNGQLRDVLISVYGLEIGGAALEILPVDGSPGSHQEQPANGIRVGGFVSPPSLHRANRGYITLFVNGRWVRDASLTYAVVQAYHTLLPNGRYPLAVVLVDVPSEDVDVNVHPAKAEVRFRDGDAVFRAVQKAVRHTLLERSPVPALKRAPASWPDSSVDWHGSERNRRRERLAGLRPQSVDRQLRWTQPTADGRGQRSLEQRPSGAGAGGPLQFGEATPGPEVGHPSSDVAVPMAQRLPPLRVVGQLGLTYIVAEGPAGMYLIDQHAAHERVLFERLLAERERAGVASQTLLEPEPVELTPEAAGLLDEHLEVLNDLGLQVEFFGGRTMLVRALPAIVAQTPPDQVLEDVAAALEAGDVPLSGTVEEAVARRVCKRAAIKAGQVMAQAEMEELVRTLEQCANPHTCPHGRPTMIHLSVAQLAREFGREGT